MASAAHRIRRVGYRSGTDDELAALHAVESEVETERRPGRVWQPLDAFVRFARTLPSQFDDHAWLAEATDGSPVGLAYCWSNAAGDPSRMECDLMVCREHRRHGLGSRLLAEVVGMTEDEGRQLLTWSTFGAVQAGEAFSVHVGARPGRVNRTSELVLVDVDWAMVEGWVRAPRARDLGYQLEAVDGVFPEQLREDAVTFHHIMQTAPRDDLEVGDVMIDADFVAELDRNLVEAGTVRWTLLVRDRHGACVGGTEVHYEPWDPEVVLQQNTGVDPAHRGLGLAKWVKAAMLLRIRDEWPDAERVRTGNAYSNAAMLAVNDALGFEVTSSETDWQARADEIRFSRG
jgi:mycothiol synthase